MTETRGRLIRIDGAETSVGMYSGYMDEEGEDDASGNNSDGNIRDHSNRNTGIAVGGGHGNTISSMSSSSSLSSSTSSSTRGGGGGGGGSRGNKEAMGPIELLESYATAMLVQEAAMSFRGRRRQNDTRNRRVRDGNHDYDPRGDADDAFDDDDDDGNGDDSDDDSNDARSSNAGIGAPLPPARPVLVTSGVERRRALELVDASVSIIAAARLVTILNTAVEDVESAVEADRKRNEERFDQNRIKLPKPDEKEYVIALPTVKRYVQAMERSSFFFFFFSSYHCSVVAAATP